MMQDPTSNADATIMDSEKSSGRQEADSPKPSISSEHRNYLIARHGTVELDPLPSPNDADPYNWPFWKKMINLLLVSFHAMMAIFIAASILPAFPIIAAEFHCSLQRASYLASLQIAILGGAPLFWKPLLDRYGRRPIFLLSLICSLAGNIGCAKSPSYASTGVCRAIVAFFISPPLALGPAVVAETFFTKDRAKYVGLWSLFVSLAAPVAPFIFGFVAYRVSYRWIYWTLAITNGVQFVLYLFFGPETLYLRDNRHVASDLSTSSFRKQYFSFSRIVPQPLRPLEFIAPLRFMLYPCVMIPAASYAMIFLWANVMIPIEIPQLFEPKFQLNIQQLGLQYLGFIIGTLIGELMSGALSDFWMRARTKKTGVRPLPEFRLWLSYFGYVLTIVGVVVFLVQINNATPLKWNVTPLIGAAIAGAGNQIVTTILITYAIDCYHEEAPSIGVCITFVRQIWGFIGPFWFPPMFTNVGLDGSAGIAVGLITAVCLVPTALLQWKGKSWR